MFWMINPVQAMNLSLRAAMLVAEAQMVLAMRMTAMAGLWRAPLPTVAPPAPAFDTILPEAATPAPRPAPRRRASRGAARSS